MGIVLRTLFTLVAFAANSLLCRMALGDDLIDPVSFTTLRLVSGALALAVIVRLSYRRERSFRSAGSWGSAVALFTYAIAFSLAYVTLATATGALILFGAVQVTMIGAALRSGERLGSTQWLGSALALSGLVVLTAPGLTAPDPFGALLMGLSGVAWGLYTIRGKGATSPISMTAGNFLRTAPMAVGASVIAVTSAHIEPSGLLLALVSGVVTSGLGYALWYRTLRDITTTQASIVQLLVPVFAAFGGITVLSEQITLRLLLASVLILGGVALAVVTRRVVAGR